MGFVSKAELSGLRKAGTKVEHGYRHLTRFSNHQETCLKSNYYGKVRAKGTSTPRRGKLP